jgi:hypothetical protein
VLVSIAYVNKTKGYVYGEQEPFEPWTEDRGKLFRSLQREHGRCVSRVYIDGSDGKNIPVGWYFEKTARYSDTKEPYKQGTWVTLFSRPDTVVRTLHYLSLDGEEISV